MKIPHTPHSAKTIIWKILCLLGFSSSMMKRKTKVKIFFSFLSFGFHCRIDNKFDFPFDSTYAQAICELRCCLNLYIRVQYIRELYIKFSSVQRIFLIFFFFRFFYPFYCSSCVYHCFVICVAALLLQRLS